MRSFIIQVTLKFLPNFIYIQVKVCLTLNIVFFFFEGEVLTTVYVFAKEFNVLILCFGDVSSNYESFKIQL